MITIRKSMERGYADHGWLKSLHSFSFAEYYDPQQMGWGNLRVINEDRIAPGTGFAPHGHRDMEIISYVISGALAHKDDMGNVVTIKPGDIQRMSAGTGVHHSEFNHARNETTHFLQIWIKPQEKGIAPGYEQKFFSDEQKRNRLCLLASPDGRDGSITIHADALIYGAILEPGTELSLPIEPGRKSYVQVIKGRIGVNGHELESGDALKAEAETSLNFAARQPSEILVFELAAE